jgi:hypothetical protein
MRKYARKKNRPTPCRGIFHAKAKGKNNLTESSLSADFGRKEFSKHYCFSNARKMVGKNLAETLNKEKQRRRL